MGSQGCLKCLKVMSIVFNTFALLFSLTLIALGIWVKVDPNVVNLQQFVTLNPEDPILSVAAYIVIFTSIPVVVVAFFGCCGTIHENRCMLTTAMVIMTMMLIGHIAASVLVAVYRPQIIAGLHDHLITTVKEHYKPNSTIDFIQLKLECCGVDGHTDYQNSTFHKTASDYVPLSCCKVTNPDIVDLNNPDVINTTQCMKDAEILGPGESSTALNTKGCVQSALDLVDGNLPIFIGLGVGTALIELAGVISACCIHFRGNREGTVQAAAYA